MTKDNLKKHKSFLAKGDDGANSINPWYKDPKKLVAAALNEDPDRRKALIEGLENIVKKDREFGIKLLEIIKIQSEGKQGQRLERPSGVDEWIYSHVNAVLKLDKAKSKEEAFILTSNYFIENKIRTLGEASVKKIYYKVKKMKEG
jgi:hypothetical protein